MSRERCLDSLFDNFSECCKRREALQRAETEARQKCEIETGSLKKKADQLENAVQEEIIRCGTLFKEALSATQEHASAKTKQIQCEVKSVIAQADLDIAQARMELPGRLWSKRLMAARYYALYGDAMKDARSRYLDAYEGAIREHEASLMAEDMELVALHLSWRTKRMTSTRSCKLDLDEKWTERINLCQQRAAPVRSAYEASKRSCRDDLQTGCATATSELSSRREDRCKKGDELDAEFQKLVDAITHLRDKKLAKLKAEIVEIEKEHRRQAQKLRDDYRTQVSSLNSSVQLGFQSLQSAIKKRQKVFDRERDIISKDLRAVQATLTLMTSAIQTFGQDPNSRPDTRTPRPPSNRDSSGACPCGCGRWCGPNHRGQRSNNFASFFSQLPGKFEFDPRQRTYEKFEGHQRADESRRQREVDEDELRRNEERLKREKAEAQARAERETRERLREQAKRRQEEETRKRDEEDRRKREDEERRRAEADRRAREEEERKRREEEERKQREEEERKQREEEERKQREEEESRKRAEEERRRREDARRREEEEPRRREESQQDQQQQQHSSNGEGGDAQGATSENDIDEDDRSGGTRGHSTARGKTKFVYKCWNKYTDAWSRLMASGVLRLRFQEIPWPILPPRKRAFTKMSITDILTRISKEAIRTFILDPGHLQSISPKARIRKELLRFHPDKRTQWLKNVKDEEKEQVDDACKQIVLHLTDLLNTAA